MPVESEAERLRTAGLWVTQPRLAVLSAVRDRPHLDADRITRLFRTCLGRVSGQPVYDALHALTGVGLLRRIAPTGGPAGYELGGDDHDHLGRTFSYSDTQRYRVGPNYLQLPVNRPREDVVVSTNQGGGQMSYGVDNRGGNPHLNFEPSSVAGLREADESYREYRPIVSGQIIPDRAAEQLRPGRTALPRDGRPGPRRPDPQPDHPARPVRQAHPGEDGLALQPVRRGVRPPRGPASRSTPDPRPVTSAPPVSTGGALACGGVHNVASRTVVTAETAGSASRGDYVSFPRCPSRGPAPRPGHCPVGAGAPLRHVPGEV